MAIKQKAPFKSKKELAKELGVSRASLYYKPKMIEKDLKFKVEIEKVMQGNKAYGHKRIAWNLEKNKKKVLRVMKKFNLMPQRRRKAPKKTQDQNQAPMAVPNLIQGIITEAPNQVWACDFTYLPYFGKFAYLATVEDLFTREIIGWEISFRHNADLVAGALLNALSRHLFTGIIHSDQGSEYRSKKYQTLLQNSGIKQSMSKKSSPWQNGHQESFYSEFKLELGHPECYSTFGELIEAIALQIHYYNKERIHTALKCSPRVFAEKYKTQKMFQSFKNNLTFQEIANVQSV
jgi:transposase InsO family protein